jgi:hypothetical protein
MPCLGLFLVPLCHRDVAEETSMLCSPDRALSKRGRKGRFVHLGQHIQTGRKGEGCRLEDRFSGGVGSKVEWTHIKTIITPKDLVSQA